MSGIKQTVNKVTQMVNISEEPITISIGGAPGDGVTEYSINPGEAVPFHENLCKPVPGAGHLEMPSILSRQSMRDFPDGIRRPVLIPAADVKKVKEQYAGELARWKQKGSLQPKQEQPPSR